MLPNAKQESVSYLANLMPIVLEITKCTFPFHRLVLAIFDVVTHINN